MTPMEVICPNIIKRKEYILLDKNVLFDHYHKRELNVPDESRKEEIMAAVNFAANGFAAKKKAKTV